PIGADLNATGSSLPSGATLNTTRGSIPSSAIVTFTWTPTSADNDRGLVVIVIASSFNFYTTVSFSYIVISPILPLPPPPSNSLLVDSFNFTTSCLRGRQASQSPLRMLSPRGPIVDNDTSVANYCFSITRNTSMVGVASMCRFMNSVRNLHLIINANCLPDFTKSKVNATISSGLHNRLPITSTSIQWKGTTYGMLNIKRINDFYFTLDKGTQGLLLEICLPLGAAKVCNSPSTLCFGPTCVYQLDDDLGCCSTSEVPY
ncbi:hypothetical protein VaNZ11_006722, partial [Volvox africanus]